MSIFLFFLALMTAVFIHELAHATALIRRGGKVTRIAVGIPIGIRPLLKFPIKIRGQKVMFELHILLLGGLMQPASESEVDNLSYRHQMEMLRAGLIANIVTGISALLLLIGWKQWEAHTGSPFITVSIAVLILFFTFNQGLFFKEVSKIGSAIHRFLNSFWNTFILLVGVGIFVLIFIAITDDPKKSLVEDNGMIKTYQTMNELSEEINTVPESGVPVSPLKEFLTVFGILSLSLALMNATPMYPLDGGRMIGLVLERYFPKKKLVKHVTYGIGIALVLILIISALAADIINVFK